MNHFHAETLDLRPLDIRVFILGISEIQVFSRVTDSRWKKKIQVNHSLQIMNFGIKNTYILLFPLFCL